MKPMYAREGVLLLNVSSYNNPSQSEQELYIIGYDQNHSECNIERIFGTLNLISSATFDKNNIAFTFSIATVIVRVFVEAD